jgi:ethanolamine utilization cobalamin adenosyltransferase
VRKAKKEGKLILLEKSTLLTPSAKDYGNKWKIFKRD